jgi:hypothetical protein
MENTLYYGDTLDILRLMLHIAKKKTQEISGVSFRNK